MQRRYCFTHTTSGEEIVLTVEGDRRTAWREFAAAHKDSPRWQIRGPLRD